VIVALSGYCQWRLPAPGEEAPRQRFYVRAAAAVWMLWSDADGHKLRSVALVTTEANSNAGAPSF
jgi:putative SOS response-associated peptidase YedK